MEVGVTTRQGDVNMCLFDLLIGEINIFLQSESNLKIPEDLGYCQNGDGLLAWIGCKPGGGGQEKRECNKGELPLLPSQLKTFCCWRIYLAVKDLEIWWTFDKVNCYKLKNAIEY